MSISDTPAGRARSTLTEVRAFREAAIRNGYSLVRVRSRGKAPVAQGWQNGEAAELLLEVTTNAENTGMLCRGFVVVDVDCDDPKRVLDIVGAVRHCLPQNPLIRRRAGSPRCAII